MNFPCNAPPRCSDTLPTMYISVLVVEVDFNLELKQYTHVLDLLKQKWILSVRVLTCTSFHFSQMVSSVLVLDLTHLLLEIC